VRRAFKFLVGALVVVVLAAGGFVAWYVLANKAPGKPKLSACGPITSDAKSTIGPWHVDRRAGVYVGYRIRELFGDAILKRDAVGRTPTVSGRMTIAGGHVTAAVVSADLRDLESGRAARDSYIQDNALDSNKYPTGRFTLTKPIALPAHIERGTAIRARANGRLLLHGVTRPINLDLQACTNGSTVNVVGTAPITLADYGIHAPDTVIAKVDDHGSIEVNLVFAPGAR
jgi:polyisoprenoid-binding protein YceI